VQADSGRLTNGAIPAMIQLGTHPARDRIPRSGALDLSDSRRIEPLSTLDFQPSTFDFE